MPSTRSKGSPLLGSPLLPFDPEPERILQTLRRMAEQVHDGVQDPPPVDPNAVLPHVPIDPQHMADLQTQQLLEQKRREAEQARAAAETRVARLLIVEFREAKLRLCGHNST